MTPPRRNRLRSRRHLVDPSACFTLAPDWGCEVLSPSTCKLDLVHKRPIYASAGIGHLWLVDPVERILEAFRLHDGKWQLIATVEDDDPVRIAPFEAVTFSLAELWD